MLVTFEEPPNAVKVRILAKTDRPLGRSMCPLKFWSYRLVLLYKDHFGRDGRIHPAIFIYFVVFFSSFFPHAVFNLVLGNCHAGNA